MNFVVFLVCWCFLSASSACNSNPKPKKVTVEPRSLDIVEPCEEVEVDDVKNDDQIRKISKANAAFFVDLYKDLGSSENLFISPYSIFSALSLVYAGAAGDTKKSYEKVLRYAAPEGDVEAGAKKMMKHLSGVSQASEKLSVETANSLFIDESFAVKESYRRRVECFYGANTTAMQIQEKPEEATGKINEWVSQKTAHKIKDILPQGSLDSRTQAVLVNALYFSAPWAHPFSPSFATTAAPFTLADGGSVTADFMKASASLPYQSLNGLEVVELAYTSCQSCRNPSTDFAMYVFSPVGPSTVAQLESAVLAPGVVTGEGLALKHTALRLELPRFSVSHSESLLPVLRGMGLVTEGGLDRLADEDLAITAVMHKAFIKVDEKGTEAAAATAVFASRMMFIPEVEMKVDRPFMVSLVHKPSRLLLFAGRIGRPDRLQSKP